MMLTLELMAATLLPAPKIGMPDCDTSCGNVSVPYPFGLGPDRCYRPASTSPATTESPINPHGTAAA